MDYLLYANNKTYRFDELDGWNEETIQRKIEEIKRSEGCCDEEDEGDEEGEEGEGEEEGMNTEDAEGARRWGRGFLSHEFATTADDDEDDEDDEEERRRRGRRCGGVRHWLGRIY